MKFFLKFLYLTLFSLISSMSEDEMLKHSKAFACMMLLRRMIENGNGDREAFSLSLIQCYTTIDLAQINSLMGIMQTGGDLNEDDEQFKGLLNGNEIKQKKSPEEIQELTLEINSIIRQFQQRQMGMNVDDDGESNNGVPKYGLFSKMLIGLLHILAIDGYLRYGFLIVLGFLLLKAVSSLCRDVKKKTHNVKITETPEEKDKTTEKEKNE